MFNDRKLVIAQYHPRFYTDARIVPNMIDIWDEGLLPAEKPSDRVRIFFSWATERRGGWGDKGSAETRRILDRIKGRYEGRVEVVVMNNKPYRECLEAKRSAHICIDECVTGSYHLQSLEGSSVGAATFNALDDQTAGFLREITGTGEHPFVKTCLARLFDDLCHQIEHSDELAQRGQGARAWMERYWNPRVLVRRFARAYYDVLLLGKIRLFPAPVEPLPPVLPKGDVAARPPALAAARPVATAPRMTAIPVRPAAVCPAAVASVSIRADPLVGRPIAELHRQNAGEEIVIFGTGPSLFAVDPEAYRGKTCIGINLAFEVVPHIRYDFMHAFELYQTVARVIPLEQCVLPETLVFRSESNGPASPGISTRVPNSASAAWVYRLQDPYERNLARKSVSLAPDATLFTWSTAAHSRFISRRFWARRRSP
jgi:hypothetical protein